MNPQNEFIALVKTLRETHKDYIQEPTLKKMNDYKQAAAEVDRWLHTIDDKEEEVLKTHERETAIPY